MIFKSFALSAVCIRLAYIKMEELRRSIKLPGREGGMSSLKGEPRIFVFTHGHLHVETDMSFKRLWWFSVSTSSR